MTYKYYKRKINDLYSQINPETGKFYTGRDIVKKLEYGDHTSMTQWLKRNGNTLVSFWLNEHEMKLARELFGS